MMYEMQKRLREGKVYTICEEARCPNISDCFSSKTASFLLLGNHCTRGCAFCNVAKGKPKDIREEEIEEISKIIKDLDLKYVVLTSVTRDDLEDGGAKHFANAVRRIKEIDSNIKVDVLVPDFKGLEENVLKVIDSKPDVFSHNIETVKRLTNKIRDSKSSYDISLKVLKIASSSRKVRFIKSGIMLGLGEEEKEIYETIYDLKNNGCNILTIGQYLQPNKNCMPVVRYIEPVFFERYKKFALEIGFEKVIAGSYVRSSYNLRELFE